MTETDKYSFTMEPQKFIKWKHTIHRIFNKNRPIFVANKGKAIYFGWFKFKKMAKIINKMKYLLSNLSKLFVDMAGKFLTN